MASSSREEWKSQAFTEQVFPKCGHCLKSNPTRRCSRCQNMFYCGADCQKEHWQDHKVYCLVTSDKILSYLSEDWVIKSLPVVSYFRNSIRAMVVDDATIDTTVDFVRTGPPLKIADNGLINEETPEQNARYISGCDAAISILYILCMNRGTQTVHPEMAAQLCFLDIIMHSKPPTIKKPIVYSSLYSKFTYNEQGKYYGRMALSNRFHHPILLQQRQTGVVVFNIRDERDSGLERTWEEQIATTTTNHYFLLVVTPDASVIVQSFFGHYTYREWLDFEKPLMQIKTPPAPRECFSPIEPYPEFRGKFDHGKRMKLLKALESLTIPGRNHRKTYARITGVQLKSEMMKESYTIRYFCLHPNQINFR